MFPLLIAAAAVAANAAPPPKGLTLTGTVLNSAGKPLPGATVFIVTARPREGPGQL